MINYPSAASLFPATLLGARARQKKFAGARNSLRALIHVGIRIFFFGDMLSLILDVRSIVRLPEFF